MWHGRPNQHSTAIYQSGLKFRHPIFVVNILVNVGSVTRKTLYGLSLAGEEVDRPAGVKHRLLDVLGGLQYPRLAFD